MHNIFYELENPTFFNSLKKIDSKPLPITDNKIITKDLSKSPLIDTNNKYNPIEGVNQFLAKKRDHLIIYNTEDISESNNKSRAFLPDYDPLDNEKTLEHTLVENITLINKKEIDEMDEILHGSCRIKTKLEQKGILIDQQRGKNIRKFELKEIHEKINYIDGQKLLGDLKYDYKPTSIKKNYSNFDSSNIFFKLFYKDKEVDVKLKILNTCISKSLLSINWLLNLEDIDSLNIRRNFEISAKLEMIDKGKDELTTLILHHIANSGIAIVQDNIYYFAILHMKNLKVLKLLDINNRENIFLWDDLILIIQITSSQAIENIKKIIKYQVKNNWETLLDLDINKGLNSKSNYIFKSKEKDVEGLKEKEKEFNDLMKEAEELRKFKNQQRDIIEEMMTKKVSDIKIKYKTYYEKLIENQKNNYLKLKQEKEDVNNNLGVIKLAENENKVKIEMLKKELVRVNFEFELYKEKNENFYGYEEINKRLKETEYNVKEMENQNIILQKKIHEYEINNDREKEINHSFKLKVDEYMIEEKYEDFNFESEVKDEYSKKYICFTCNSQQRNSLYIDCLHLATCWECTINNLNKNNKSKNLPKNTKNENLVSGKLNCPICQKENFGFKKIFIA